MKAVYPTYEIGLRGILIEIVDEAGLKLKKLTKI